MSTKTFWYIAALVGLVSLGIIFSLIFFKNKGDSSEGELISEMQEGAALPGDYHTLPEETKDGVASGTGQESTAQNGESKEDSGDVLTSTDLPDKNTSDIANPEEENGMPEEPENTVTSMVALAESEEEAKQIAELYGIKFVDYAYGVATFETSENPQEVIKRGEKNHYTSISVNGWNYAD